MACNKVQFQKGMSLPEFLQHYGTEDKCFEALFKWRWPNGFQCPSSGHDKLSVNQSQIATVQLLSPPNINNSRYDIGID